ncbi:hypothetical protein GCM10009843_10450 [Nocardioides bigeumensis]|uniref:Metallo-peptidase family M12B Reprolysin-like n=1 Tax=Nocardioides bigeumensis TaxID=433657 RepID=A0ABN2XX56_9ACTN
MRSVVSALVLVAVTSSGGSAPTAHATDAGTDLTLTGRLIAAGEDELVYALARDDGALVPVTGDLDGLVGDRVTARLQVPGPLDARPGSPLTQEALGSWGLPLAASVVSASDVASAAAPVEHRVFVAKPTNVGAFTLTDAQLLAELGTVAAFWVDEADGEITSFDLPTGPDDSSQFKTYSTATGASAVCALSGQTFTSQVQEAAALFPGANFFGGAATDLLVVLTPDQGCDAGTVGIGSVGSGYTGGGATINRTETSYFESVLAHELGHNFGLAHSNVGSAPYRNVYNVMAYALSDVNQLTAQSTAYRVGTGLDDAGEVETVAIPDPQQAVTVSRTLKPRADTSGLRALEVTAPDTGRTYYVEYRAGLGQDAGSAYASNSMVGGYQFRPGVVVEEIYDNDPGIGVSLVTNTPGTRVATAATQTWTSPEGNVTVSVTSTSTTGADVTLSYSPPVPFAAAPTIALPAGPRAGDVVTPEVVGAWDPAPSSIDVQWLLDGGPIGGATSSSLTPTSSMVGHQLSVQMTASAPGLIPSVVTAPAVTVQPAPEPPPTPPPATLLGAVPLIDGDARVGGVLTGQIGAWTPGASLAVQWLADNAAIPGATTTTFTPGPAQQGAVLKLQVVGTLGGKSLTRTSAGTPKVARGILTPVAATIKGKAVVGRKVRVRTGTWPTGTTFTYRWFADGKKVKRARGAGKALTVTGAMVGQRLRVRVTASLPGYTPLVVTSPRSRRVRS